MNRVGELLAPGSRGRSALVAGAVIIGFALLLAAEMKFNLPIWVLFAPLIGGVYALLVLKRPVIGLFAVLFVFFFPVQMGGVTLLQALGAVTAGITVIWFLREGRGLRLGNAVIPLLILGALIVGSLVFTQDLTRTTFYIRRWTFNMIFYLLMVNIVTDFKGLKRVTWAIIAAAAINAVFGVFEFATASDLTFRAEGLQENQNVFGNLAALGFPLVFYQYLYRTGARRWLGLALSALMVAGVVVSVSRGAFIAFFLVCLLFLILERRRSRYLLIAVLLATLAFPLLPGYFVERMGSIVPDIQRSVPMGEQQELTKRGVLNKAGVKMWMTSPIWGIGAGNFGTYFVKPEFNPGIPATKKIVPHSVYMQALVEFGIIGILALLWVVASTLRNLVMSRRHWSRDTEGWIYFGAIEMMALIVFTQNLSWGTSWGRRCGLSSRWRQSPVESSPTSRRPGRLCPQWRAERREWQEQGRPGHRPVAPRRSRESAGEAGAGAEPGRRVRAAGLLPLLDRRASRSPAGGRGRPHPFLWPRTRRADRSHTAFAPCTSRGQSPAGPRLPSRADGAHGPRDLGPQRRLHDLIDPHRSLGTALAQAPSRALGAAPGCLDHRQLHAGRSFACRYYDLAAERIRFVPNGVESIGATLPDRAESRRGLGLEHDAAVVLGLFRLSPEKDLETFCAAAERALEGLPGALFLVAGDGPLRGWLERRAAAASRPDLFQVLGPRDDVPRLLAAADVMLMTSLSEGMPNGVLEAMAAGLPVVATAVGGVPDLVEEARTGNLLKPGDADGLAAACRALLDDRATRQAMGACARMRAGERILGPGHGRDLPGDLRRVAGGERGGGKSVTGSHLIETSFWIVAALLLYLTAVMPCCSPPPRGCVAAGPPAPPSRGRSAGTSLR